MIFNSIYSITQNRYLDRVTIANFVSASTELQTILTWNLLKLVVFYYVFFKFIFQCQLATWLTLSMILENPTPGTSAILPASLRLWLPRSWQFRRDRSLHPTRLRWNWNGWSIFPLMSISQIAETFLCRCKTTFLRHLISPTSPCLTMSSMMLVTLNLLYWHNHILKMISFHHKGGCFRMSLEYLDTRSLTRFQAKKSYQIIRTGNTISIRARVCLHINFFSVGENL